MSRPGRRQEDDINAAATGQLIYQVTDYREGDFAETDVAAALKANERDPSRAPLVADTIGPLCSNEKAAGSATNQDAEAGMLVVSEVAFAVNSKSTRQDATVETLIPVAFTVSSAGSNEVDKHARETNVARCLDQTGGFTQGQGGTVVAFAENQQAEIRLDDVLPQLNTGGGKPGQGYPAVLVEEAFQCHGSNVGPMGTIRAGNGNETGGVPFVPTEEDPVVFQTRIARNGRGQPKDVVDSLTSSEGGTHADSKPHVAGRFGVRRLTPLECERCQGMPDNFTKFGIDENGKTVKLSDSARYKLIGNSVAIPNVEWIMRRIAAQRER